MKNRYFDFLCHIVEKEDEYKKLLGQLHDTDFYSLIPNDDNRAEDGKQFREIFTNDYGRQALSFSETDPCTVLEMLIGLSFRLEFELSQSIWEKTPSEWFWILVDNLELSEYNDENYDDEIVVSIIEKFLSRGHERNGNGGLFPLKRPQKDQRRVEIWYQMSAYVLENYPI